MINNRIRHYHQKIEELDHEIKVKKKSLKDSINNNNFNMQVNNFIFHSKEKTFKSIRNTQIKKFDNLLANKNLPSNTPEDSNQDPFEDKWVYNLSNKPLLVAEKSLLQKGPKFAITPTTLLSLTILLPPRTFAILWMKILLSSQLIVWSITPKSNICLPIIATNQKLPNQTYPKKKGRPCVV